MSYFTKTEAIDASRYQRLTKSATEILRESVSTSSDYDRYDVFLSHSMSDADLVLGVKSILEKSGNKVYVDWLVDPQLDRSAVNASTAAQLRKRMRQSSSMIYIATNNSTSSKWMPWELGYFDGYKDGGVAILPLVDRIGEDFVGQEYIGLYPTVEKNKWDTGREDIFVEDRGNKRWTTLTNFRADQPQWRN